MTPEKAKAYTKTLKSCLKDSEDGAGYLFDEMEGDMGKDILELLNKLTEGHILYPPFKISVIPQCHCKGAGVWYGGVDGDIEFRCACQDDPSLRTR